MKLHKTVLKTMAAVLLSFGGLTAQATSIYDASFTESGELASGIVTLDSFIVMGFYNNNTAFITDGSGAYGRIYVSSSSSPSITGLFQVGGRYSGAMIAASPYFGYQQFISPTGTTLVSTDNAFEWEEIADISTISSASTLAGNPSAGENFDLVFAPVTFSFTAAENTELSTGSLFISDAGGTLIQFYRTVSTDALVAGQTYTVTGFVMGYNSMVEIVSANFAAVPEPGSVVLLMLGGGLFGGWVIWRRIGASSWR